MSFATYEYRGERHVGEVDDNYLLPLQGLTEIGTATTSAALRTAVRLVDQRVSIADVHLLPVVPNPSKVLCVGLNYADHIAETNRETPTYPVLFPKYASSLIGPVDDIVMPPEATALDWEGELAVVIGTPGRRISRDNALDHVAGYTVANDITMRDYQYKTHQWLQGKAWDNLTPIGPYLVPPDEVDLANSGIRTLLNGEVVQQSTVGQLVFDVRELIAVISEFTALQPGDIILTGTPGGVGYRAKPQRLLTPGDTITVEIDGVGRIESQVVAQ